MVNSYKWHTDSYFLIVSCLMDCDHRSAQVNQPLFCLCYWLKRSLTPNWSNRNISKQDFEFDTSFFFFYVMNLNFNICNGWFLFSLFFACFALEGSFKVQPVKAFFSKPGGEKYWSQEVLKCIHGTWQKQNIVRLWLLTFCNGSIHNNLACY